MPFPLLHSSTSRILSGAILHWHLPSVSYLLAHTLRAAECSLKLMFCLHNEVVRPLNKGDVLITVVHCRKIMATNSFFPCIHTLAMWLQRYSHQKRDSLPPPLESGLVLQLTSSRMLRPPACEWAWATPVIQLLVQPTASQMPDRGVNQRYQLTSDSKVGSVITCRTIQMTLSKLLTHRKKKELTNDCCLKSLLSGSLLTSKH